jgi:L-alanine-DL-glutamate epimerase-like enolase superfamily enzyme
MLSRRQFLQAPCAAPLFAAPFWKAAAAEAGKHKIRDVQTMMMQGGRTYTLVKITAESGAFGIGEAYGSPGIGVREQILGLKSWLIRSTPASVRAAQA